MEPHRPPPLPRDVKPQQRPSAAKDALPIGRAWLAREAIRYIARWESSQQGVREVLNRKLEARCARSGEDPEEVRSEIGDVVADLVRQGYIDDARFATQLYARLRGKGSSLAKIHARLEAKGISSELIREIESERLEGRRDAQSPHDPEAIRDIDEELEAAERTAQKKRLGPYCPDPERRASHRQRHLAVLARQGFSSEIAHRVIDAGLTNSTFEFTEDLEP